MGDLHCESVHRVTPGALGNLPKGTYLQTPDLLGMRGDPGLWLDTGRETTSSPRTTYQPKAVRSQEQLRVLGSDMLTVV